MGRAALSSQTCTIASAAALAGYEWAIIILRETFLGTRRFDNFLRQTVMSSHLLSQRLNTLETSNWSRSRVMGRLGSRNKRTKKDG